MRIIPCGWVKTFARENAFSRVDDSLAPVPLFSRAVPLTNRMETKGDSVHENLSCTGAALAPEYSLRQRKVKTILGKDGI